MRDGKALQTATSHYLGQGFPRAFGVRYTGRDGRQHHPYATSWGATTRLVGGVVMAHGDDRGLRLPPRRTAAGRDRADRPRRRPRRRARGRRGRRRRVGRRLSRPRRRPCRVRPGFKFNEWELKGVPLRIELGGRDLAAGAVTVARRDTGEKQQIPLARAAAACAELLSDVQASLLESARAELERRTLRAPGRLQRAGRVPPRLRPGSSRRRGAAAASARRASRTTAPRRSAACRSTSNRRRPRNCVCCGRSAATAAVWAQAY